MGKNVHYLAISLFVFLFSVYSYGDPTSGGGGSAPIPPVNTSGLAIGQAPPPHLSIPGGTGAGPGSPSGNIETIYNAVGNNDSSRDVAGSEPGVRAGSGDRGSSPQRTPCQIFHDSENWTLRNLDYLGISFDNYFTVRDCINASTDQAAINAARYQCPNSTGGRIINPANPQYFSQSDANHLRELAEQSGFTQGELARDSNPFGFYLCVTRDPRYEKSAICEGMNAGGSMRGQSRWPQDALSRLEFRWRPTGDGDGNCECRATGEGDWRLCTRPEDAPPEPCAQAGMQPDNRPDRPAGTTLCRCEQVVTNTASASAGGTIGPVAQGQFRVERYVPPGSPCQAEEVAPQQMPTEATVSLKTCVDGWKERADRCAAVSQTARTACTAADAQNQPTNQSADMLSNASAFHTQVNAGTGAQNECFKASLISNSAINFIRDRQQKCDGEYNACVSACAADSAQSFETACNQVIEAETLSRINTHQPAYVEEERRLNTAYFNQHREAIRSAFTGGNQVCSGEVRRDRSLADQAVTGLGDSLSQSTRCMCQLSSSGGNCATATPSIAECNANPSAAGCDIYSAINACSPGATYNAVACNCELNPTTAGCRASSTNSLSGFASADARIAAATSVGAPLSVAGTSAAGSASGVDLSGGAVDASAADLASGDGSSAADSAGLSAADSAGLSAGGGAGGVGGGGTVAGTEEAAAEDEESKGIGGLLSSAKTFFTKALGGKSNPNGALGNGKGAAKASSVRGLASTRRPIATKNADIWKLMNSCVQGETCRANQNNYITNP